MTLNINDSLTGAISQALKELYGIEQQPADVVLQETRRDFKGDSTLVVFPYVKQARKSPEAVAAEIGEAVKKALPEVSGYNVIKGFLNFEIADSYWLRFLAETAGKPLYGITKSDANTAPVVVEYSSPNTNKPLHLGHIRNNLLGWSVSQLLAAAGANVKKVNLVNDRGIHICRSMLAWLRYGNGETPESSGMKGDHLVGKYYVEFDKHYKEEVRQLMESGVEEEQAKKDAPLMVEAQSMLKRWEEGDKEVRDLWEKMNGWVYAGFDETYRRLGVGFDKVYYESNTYLLGKELVQKGLDMGVLFRKEDGSVWCDLTGDGLDQKLLLRRDGTSVYMTQDLGTALLRHNDFGAEQLIYVVGNEQDYHFKVLKLILGKLGFPWADKVYHLSYGMVELPNGKMKSREGTVVDADDLMQLMIDDAYNTSMELGKFDDMTEEERREIARIVGLGALKYFILKVDARKNMLFNPEESIDFNGNTGPFIQYTYARIRSILRKSNTQEPTPCPSPGEGSSVRKAVQSPLPSGGAGGGFLSDKEIELIQKMNEFGAAVEQAGKDYSPSGIANYCYELTKVFNQFYHDYSILNEPDEQKRNVRLVLARNVAKIIKNGMSLLGIEVPERM
jgi:arginyl-tRNA synthetase